MSWAANVVEECWTGSVTSWKQLAIYDFTVTPLIISGKSMDYTKHKPNDYQYSSHQQNMKIKIM